MLLLDRPDRSGRSGFPGIAFAFKKMIGWIAPSSGDKL
jgi:hypothetical protein